MNRRNDQTGLQERNGPSTSPADYLNPRRRLYAEKLLAYVVWNAGKIFLDPSRYRDIGAELRLDRYQVDGAADDLYSLGAVDMRLCGDGCMVVESLVRDLDDVRPAPQPIEMPRRRVI